MIENNIYNTIINNPIYLAMTVILLLLLLYSALKKFIKLLAIILVATFIYIGFLYFTNDKQTIEDVDSVIDTMKNSKEFIKEKMQDKLDVAK
tara:strand:- start:292 stop:567 length:276 start_codon:yes stop_codon:yes gene_type:complete